MRRLGEITLRFDERPAPPPSRANRTRAPGFDTAQKKTARRAPRRPAPGWWNRARRPLVWAVLASALMATAVWLVHSGRITSAKNEVTGIFLNESAKVGLKIEQVTVQGRQRTAREDLLAALALRQGDPILGLDLNRLRKQVESIPWVKTASLERNLPDELHVVITEREPVAIWQHDSRYFLVDGDGLVIGEKIDDFSTLPLVVGDGAPDHAAELIVMLNSEPALAKRVKAAQWISDRRWNIVMDHDTTGIQVELPEDAPTDAWHQLAALDRDHQLLERKVSVVDMRLPDRLIVRVANGVTPPTAIPVQKRKPVPGRDA